MSGKLEFVSDQHRQEGEGMYQMHEIGCGVNRGGDGFPCDCALSRPMGANTITVSTGGPTEFPIHPTPSIVADAELLPCPFCGDLMKTEYRGENIWKHKVVSHTGRRCIMGPWIFSVENWNRRSHPQPLTEGQEEALRVNQAALRAAAEFIGRPFADKEVFHGQRQDEAWGLYSQLIAALAKGATAFPAKGATPDV